jgi:ribosome modulation factor
LIAQIRPAPVCIAKSMQAAVLYAQKGIRMAKKAKAAEATQQLNPEDELTCFEEYCEMRGEMARISGKIAKHFERYKKMGVNTKVMPKNYALSLKENASEVMAQQLAQAKRLQIIVWETDGQGSFGKALDPAEPSPEFAAKIGLMKVRADGYRAGYGGQDKGACPHQPGTEQHVHWLDQFHKGNADRQADGKGDVTEAQPRKRGRPRKEADGIGLPAGNA